MCSVDQWTGFYMMGTSVMIELIVIVIFYCGDKSCKQVTDAVDYNYKNFSLTMSRETVFHIRLQADFHILHNCTLKHLNSFMNNVEKRTEHT